MNWLHRFYDGLGIGLVCYISCRIALYIHDQHKEIDGECLKIQNDTDDKEIEP